ncbi:nickel resistance protein [Novosphingobium umbonatum]|uniref:Nickel resistance protein n=1 Tax=Novosphingobium umbonatum TaxID=1908524 RepID=A0A3S2US32_9SPHN|nr:metal-sensing transcriptional repressor [Novosphingobium umbonatum]RVU03318.1 nickel resistance protein [Novosphingobium umbonatum]
MSHTTDKDLINRLRRANGHLAKIVTMIEDDRSALDVAQQLQAVIAALDKAKTHLVAHHIEHHLTETLGDLTPEARETLGRLTEIAKYL